MNSRWLFEDLCVKLGFCLSDEDRASLLAALPVTSGEFTDLVFAAEGLDPMADPDLRGQVLEVVERHLAQPT